MLTTCPSRRLVGVVITAGAAMYLPACLVVRVRCEEPYGTDAGGYYTQFDGFLGSRAAVTVLFPVIHLDHVLTGRAIVFHDSGGHRRHVDTRDGLFRAMGSG